VKRILALDGGGIRGIFTLGVLARVEDVFRTARGRPDLVLRDEFDFFAGTSTGAIIATALAWGMSVAEIEQLYIDQASRMFAPAPWHQRWKSKYPAEAITSMLQQSFCEEGEPRTPALLGTSRLRHHGELKQLLIVMRNATTGSPWPVSNNPAATYNHPSHPDCNLRFPIWQLLRASTAAPTYFLPEALHIGGATHLFIDGGVTPFNNPALLAVLMATLPCYKLEWTTGVDNLFVLSIGTGTQPVKLAKSDAQQVTWLDSASYVPRALMSSLVQQQDALCRVLGECRFGATIDSEMGDLHGPGLLTTAEKKFAYVRYNRMFDANEAPRLASGKQVRFTLDNLELIPFLQEAGRQYANQHVTSAHLLPDGP
jgi:patatin-like phospholipase/acyl hydrolase